MATKGRWRRIRPFVLFAVLAGAGFVTGQWLGGLIKRDAGAWRMDPAWYLGFPVAALAALAVHELGHLAGGWMRGFRMHLYAVGPLRISREDGRLRLGWNRGLSLWGGIAASLPPDPSRVTRESLRRSMMWVTAGGPVFSILSAFAAWPAIAVLQPRVGPMALLLLFGFTSALIGIVTLIPHQSGNFVSDGGRLRDLLRDSPASRRWTALATLGAMSNTVRPRDWPAVWVEGANELEDESPDTVSAVWLKSTWHYDRGEFEEGGAALRLALSRVQQWAAPLRPLVYLDAAYRAAVHGQDAVEARRYLELAGKGGLAGRKNVVLAQASVLIAEGRKDEARRILDGALAQEKGPSEWAPTAIQREMLQALRQQV